jgi:DNA-binding PadR family transcriptional regulator
MQELYITFIRAFTLESETEYSLTKKTVRNFLDIIILIYLRENTLTTGYEMIKHLHEKFDLLLSPGTVYLTIYSLERQNLIEGNISSGKRLYKLTEKGEREVQMIKDRTYTVLSSIFS